MAHSWLHRGSPVRRGAVLGALALALTAAGLVGGAAAAPHAAAPGATLQDCVPANARVRPGSQVSEPNQLSAAESTAAERRSDSRMRSKGLSTTKFSILPRVRVDVYVHVIRRADGTGGVTRRQIDRQINVLNTAFAGRSAIKSAKTLFRYRLAKIDYTNNDDWFDWANPDEDPSDENEAKQALHKGGKDDLNIYIAGLGGGLLGYAFYPSDPIPLWQDGVVLLNDSLPGGSAIPYNLGDTATHEVGHWLGLAHTFENACDYPGDYVRDTPYQDDGDNIFSCDESLDTCKQPGKDPVHNFMSYGDDPCLNRFTNGQSVRMAVQWFTWRSPITLP